MQNFDSSRKPVLHHHLGKSKLAAIRHGGCRCSSPAGCRVVQPSAMKTSFFGKASNVAAGFPKFTASTSAGCPAIHWDTSTV